MEFDLFEAPIPIAKSDLEFQRKIGDGAFASVWQVRHTQTGEIFALKIVQKSKVSKILDQFRREVSIMYEVDHPHIVKLHTHFEDIRSFYLLMELLEGGSLFQKLCKEKSFSEQRAFYFFSQIASGIKYLHSRSPPIIHRDLKPENILLDKKGRVKITDFGWANYMCASRYTICGTLEYLPPEIVEERRHDLSLDIWCLGVLLYEMLCGATPFKANVKEIQMYNITKGLVRFPKKISMNAKDLIGKMLERDQGHRIDICDVIEHEWMKSKEIPEVPYEKAPVLPAFNETSSSKSTKESVCAEESQKKCDVNEELIIAKERLCYLAHRIEVHKSEKKLLTLSKKKFLKSVYEADLEITHLKAVDNILTVTELIMQAKNLIFEKSQMCKKQNILLANLKLKIQEKTSEINEKEETLASLRKSSQSASVGFMRIKSYKSLDISSMQIDLDIILSQLEDKSISSSNSIYNVNDMMKHIQTRVGSLKESQNTIYEEKIAECNEKAMEITQKITELTIYYNEIKGKIMQGYRKVREELVKTSKKCKEEAAKSHAKSYFQEKSFLAQEISKIIPLEPTEEPLQKSQNYLKVTKI